MHTVWLNLDEKERGVNAEDEKADSKAEADKMNIEETLITLRGSDVWDNLIVLVSKLVEYYENAKRECGCGSWRANWYCCRGTKTM